MQLTSSCIVVFAKAPQSGAAKTRLIPLLGAVGAAALQARMIQHTLVTAQAADLGPVQLYGTAITDGYLCACAARYGALLVKQSQGDLGDRMRAAFEKTLAESACVLLIGSDCPALTVAHLRDAARALSQGHDAVFIPTEDGGYALIGLTRCDNRLFENITWGGDSVLAATRERLKVLKWRWRELETLWDIDRPEDYRRWSELIIHNENNNLA